MAISAPYLTYECSQVLPRVGDFQDTNTSESSRLAWTGKVVGTGGGCGRCANMNRSCPNSSYRQTGFPSVPLTGAFYAQRCDAVS